MKFITLSETCHEVWTCVWTLSGKFQRDASLPPFIPAHVVSSCLGGIQGYMFCQEMAPYPNRALSYYYSL